MYSRKAIRIILCCAIAALLSFGLNPSEVCAGQSDADPPPIEIGRSNPFENIPKPQILIQQQVLDQTEPIVEAPDLFVETVTLKFLDPVSLQQAIAGMSSSFGSIIANKDGKTLIICDTREKIDRIVAQIRKADRTPRQVIIEAVLIDVQLTDDKEIGINWDILSSENYDISYRQNLTLRLGSTPENATTIGDGSAFSTTGSGGDFTLISGTIRNVVHMIQNKKNAEILASPKVAVLSGQTASIEAVEEIPYRELTQTSMGGELASVSFKQVGIKMQVTATIMDTNEILLEVEPEQNINTSVFGIENIPIIDTRKTQTTLLLKDGEVVIIGGLRRQTRSKLREQIPLLGDLPIVGALFGKNKIIEKDLELIILLSPHIHNGEPIHPTVRAKFDKITTGPPLSLDPKKKEPKKTD